LLSFSDQPRGFSAPTAPGIKPIRRGRDMGASIGCSARFQGLLPPNLLRKAVMEDFVARAN
jgi:hypothetical protein